MFNLLGTSSFLDFFPPLLSVPFFLYHTSRFKNNSADCRHSLLREQNQRSSSSRDSRDSRDSRWQRSSQSHDIKQGGDRRCQSHHSSRLAWHSLLVRLPLGHGHVYGSSGTTWISSLMQVRTDRPPSSVQTFSAVFVASTHAHGADGVLAVCVGACSHHGTIRLRWHHQSRQTSVRAQRADADSCVAFVGTTLGLYSCDDLFCSFGAVVWYLFVP